MSAQRLVGVRRHLAQYQPYVVAVALVVAVANLVDDPAEDAPSASDVVLEATQAATGASSTTSTSMAAPSAAIAAPTLPTGALFPATPGAMTGPREPHSVHTRESGAGEPAAGEEPPTGPLVIVASGYASTTAELGDPEVPDDGLPVAAGAGGPTKISFVALDGAGTALRLVLVADGRAHRLPQLAAVSACPMTEPWEPRRGQPMSEAPAHDCSDAVTGERVDDSTFMFDLATFGDPTTGHGFALVPSGDAGPFQVTFSTEAADAEGDG